VIRVGITADSPVVRAGLASLLGSEPDVRIVTTSAPSEEADVVVVVPRRATPVSDSLQSDGSDLDTRFRGPPTIVLLERMESAVAHEAYVAGASAVLAIDAGADELRAAIRAIAAGLVVLTPLMSMELLAGARTPSTDSATRSAAMATLTSREREVLSLLVQGLANKVIASRLGITEHTVKSHIATVYEKLGARNRAEVVIAAARQGLVIL